MSGTLYTVDWANHALGQPLFETEDYAQILPGGGDYDFLLVNETKLSGATLATGTVTEISALGVTRQNAAYYTVHVSIPASSGRLGASASVYLN